MSLYVSWWYQSETFTGTEESLPCWTLPPSPWVSPDRLSLSVKSVEGRSGQCQDLKTNTMRKRCVRYDGEILKTSNSVVLSGLNSSDSSTLFLFGSQSHDRSSKWLKSCRNPTAILWPIEMSASNGNREFRFNSNIRPDLKLLESAVRYLHPSLSPLVLKQHVFKSDLQLLHHSHDITKIHTADSLSPKLHAWLPFIIFHGLSLLQHKRFQSLDLFVSSGS